MKIHQWLMMHHERIISHQAALTKTWLGMFKQSIYIYINFVFHKDTWWQEENRGLHFQRFEFSVLFHRPEAPESHIHSIHVTPRDWKRSRRRLHGFSACGADARGSWAKGGWGLAKGQWIVNFKIYPLRFSRQLAFRQLDIYLLNLVSGFVLCSSQHIFSHPSASTSLTNTEAYPRLPSAAFPKAASSSAWTQLGDP